MFRVLLAYKDINTQSLLKDRFEQEGFEVFDYNDSTTKLDYFDILVCEDDFELEFELDMPTIKIAKYYTNTKGSSLIAYVNKPFRPAEVLLKARLLLKNNPRNSPNNVRKTA